MSLPVAIVDEEAERQLLARTINAGAICPEASKVDASDFRDPRLGNLWDVLARLERAGEPIDLRTVVEASEWDEAVELALSAPGGANADYYAKRVLRASSRRRLQVVVLEAQRVAAEPGLPSSAVRARILALLQGVELGRAEARPLDVLEVLKLTQDEVLARAERRASGRLLGFGLDGLLADSVQELRRGEVTVLAARPSMGKTALALNVARSAAEAGHGVLFVSLETPAYRLGLNLSAQVSGVPMLRLEDGDAAGHDLAAERLRAMPGRLLIRDRDVRRVADVDQLTWSRSLSLVVVDYLQLLQGEERGRSRYEEVTEISRCLKRLAVERGLHVIALAQLSRASEQRTNKRPLMSDLRDSGQIEQDADLVLLLHRQGYYDDDHDPEDLEIHVAKNRNGPAGERCRALFRRGINLVERRPWTPST